MRIKIFEHTGCKVRYDDDLPKVVKYFADHNINVEFTKPEKTSILLKDCPEKLYLPNNNGKQDVLMYIFDRKQRNNSLAINFSETLQVMEVSTSPVDDYVDYTWKAICHEIMHILFYKERNKGNFLQDPMDSMIVNGIVMPYYKNEELYAPDGNFAEAWKRLNKMTYKYFTQKEVDTWKLKPELWTLLDTLREACGFPFIINSGLRTKEENEALKGSVSDSAHLSGLAVDLHCIYSDRRFKLITEALKHGVTRIGIGKTFVHIDIDTSKPKSVVWHYY